MWQFPVYNVHYFDQLRCTISLKFKERHINVYTIKTTVCITFNWEQLVEDEPCSGLWLFLSRANTRLTKHQPMAKGTALFSFPPRTLIPQLQLPCQWKACEFKMHCEIKLCSKNHTLCHSFQLLCLHNTANNLPQINPCPELPSFTQAEQL